MSPCSVLFCFNNTEKNLSSPTGPLSVWGLYVLSTSAWVFSGDSSFLPNPTDERGGGQLSARPPSGCGCLAVSGLRGRLVQGGSRRGLSCRDRRGQAPGWGP